MVESYTLTEEDKNSAVWKKHKRFLEEQLNTLRDALERRNLAPHDAEYFRGQIYLIRRILDGKEI